MYNFKIFIFVQYRYNFQDMRIKGKGIPNRHILSQQLIWMWTSYWSVLWN